MEPSKLIKWVVTPRQRCDLEMLLIHAFNPLTGFISQADYEEVLSHSRLSNQQLWPMPITLDVTHDFAETISVGEVIGLCDADQTLLARMTIIDKWKPNKLDEARKVFGTQDSKHPAVDYLLNQAGTWYLGGPVQAIQYPQHHDFAELRFSPENLKKLFRQLGWETIIGFQTRNPIHRAHMELTLRAAEQIQGKILLHPVVGMTKPGDIDYYTRVRCYQKILAHYPEQKVLLSLLPLAMRMAGPREALWHALIRKNYGCTHFIVGRDHAGPGQDSQGKSFYDPYAAQQLALQCQDEIGIKIIPFQEMVYVKERSTYAPANEIQPHETPLTISGTQLRDKLRMGHPIPDWFSFPDIIQELQATYPPKYQQGFTLFFTGLSGSGKSTIAQVLLAKLMSFDKRSISIIDGDVIRRLLGDKLGFSKADRDMNIRLISYIASEITKAGGIAICAAIAPYANIRNESRQLISSQGGFIEVHLSTPLAVCEERDTKGLYAKYRAGHLKCLTGMDDPYETPQHAEITINTASLSIESAAQHILDYLHQEAYIHFSAKAELVCHEPIAASA